MNDLLLWILGFVGVYLGVALLAWLWRKWAAPTVVTNAKVIEFRSNLGPKLRIVHKIGSGVIVIDHQLRGKRQKIEVPALLTMENVTSPNPISQRWVNGLWCQEGSQFSKQTVQTTSYNIEPPTTEVHYTTDGQQVIIYKDGKSTPVYGTEVRHTSSFWIDIHFRLEPDDDVFALRYNAKLAWCKALKEAIDKIIGANVDERTRRNVLEQEKDRRLA